MGNTGQYSTGVHCHIEIDTDTKYYDYVPGLAGDTNMLKKGVDSTINPIGVLFIKPTAPQNQVLTYAAGDYAKQSDVNLPMHPLNSLDTAPTDNWQAKYQEEFAAHAQTKALLAQANTKIANALKLAKTIADTLS